MSLRCHALFLSLLGLIGACGVEVPTTDPTESIVVIEPCSASGTCPPVWHASGQFAADPLPRLFEGELSDYHLARADDEQLSSTLEQRRVPLWVRRTGPSAEAIPLSLLHGGETYSLVTASGRVTLLRVERETETWRRLWPSEAATRFAWYCRRAAPSDEQLASAPSGESAPSSESAPSREPATLSDGTPSHWRPAADGRCALLVVDEAPGPVGAVSPPSYSDVVVEPALFMARGASGTAPVCSENEQSLALGCASVLDDRIVLRSGEQSALWRISGDVSLDAITPAEQRAIVVGFEPGATHHLSLDVYSTTGASWSGQALITMARAQPHLVINEVLANPIGPEPQQEWVELVNSGSTAIELSAFSLHDGGGAVELPDVTLAPGQYALVVRQDFQPDSGWDVAPDDAALLLRVSAVGKSGLSNAGEPLWLEEASGLVISRFAPLSAREGVSWARRSLHAADDEPESFVMHAEPGASPGRPNLIAE